MTLKLIKIFSQEGITTYVNYLSAGTLCYLIISFRQRFFKLKKFNFHIEEKKSQKIPYPLPPQGFYSFHNFCTSKFCLKTSIFIAFTLKVHKKLPF